MKADGRAEALTAQDRFGFGFRSSLNSRLCGVRILRYLRRIDVADGKIIPVEEKERRD